jgi:hypothetical protein
MQKGRATMNEPNKTRTTRPARRRAALLALTLLLLAGGVPFVSEASTAETVTLEAEQTVRNAADDAAPAYGTFGYRLTPATEGAPVPGDDPSGYAFDITGTDKMSIDIPIEGPGVYGYTLRCVSVPPYCTADVQGGYRVDVCADGDLRTAVTVRYRENDYDENDKNRGKVGSVSFEHIYTPPGNETGGTGGSGEGNGNGGTGGTGGTSEAGEPGEAGEAERPAPPAPENGGSLVRLDDGSYLELDENGVPIGEWHWDEETGRWIFERYPPLAALDDRLPQTGRLLWPVPALALLGALLFLLGLASERKRARIEAETSGQTSRQTN